MYHLSQCRHASSSRDMSVLYTEAYFVTLTKCTITTVFFSFFFLILVKNHFATVTRFSEATQSLGNAGTVNQDIFARFFSRITFKYIFAKIKFLKKCMLYLHKSKRQGEFAIS